MLRRRRAHTVITSMSAFVASMSIKILGMVREVGNPNLFRKISLHYNSEEFRAETISLNNQLDNQQKINPH